MSKELTTRSSLLNQLLLHSEFKLCSVLVLYLANIIYTLSILPHFTMKNLRKLNYYYICYSLFYLRICHTNIEFSFSLSTSESFNFSLDVRASIISRSFLNEKFLD